MLKKVVLTGFPVKVHKKKAVVRWMFHAPEDVRWFRPVDLWTKHGRQGRIKVRPRQWGARLRMPPGFSVFGSAVRTT